MKPQTVLLKRRRDGHIFSYSRNLAASSDFEPIPFSEVQNKQTPKTAEKKESAPAEPAQADMEEPMTERTEPIEKMSEADLIRYLEGRFSIAYEPGEEPIENLREMVGQFESSEEPENEGIPVGLELPSEAETDPADTSDVPESIEACTTKDELECYTQHHFNEAIDRRYSLNNLKKKALILEQERDSK